MTRVQIARGIIQFLFYMSGAGVYKYGLDNMRRAINKNSSHLLESIYIAQNIAMKHNKGLGQPGEDILFFISTLSETLKNRGKFLNIQAIEATIYILCGIIGMLMWLTIIMKIS